jgi:hypothetical protein
MSFFCFASALSRAATAAVRVSRSFLSPASLSRSFAASETDSRWCRLIWSRNVSFSVRPVGDPLTTMARTALGEPCM